MNSMIEEAILHRPNKEYFYSYKDGFVLKLRSKRDDLFGVNVYYGEKWLSKENNMLKAEMTKVASDELFDYYEGFIKFKGLGIHYYFELISDETIYYGQYKFFNEKTFDGWYMFECPIVARNDDSMRVPEWSEGAVVYQIFPERFNNLDTKRKNLAAWDKTPMDRESFLGGTLKGITSKIDYLHELGVDVIYMCPIFTSPSNHKYDTIDYMNVDPDFGTNDDLRVLVDKAHSLGMHVMLDGVFNHCAYDFAPFKDVREKGKNSPFYGWFYLTDDYPVWDSNTAPNYDSFAFYGGMPKLNTANKDVRKYLFDCVKMWISDFGIDGFRLDVPEEYSIDFSSELRKEMKSVKNDSFISGEIWHESSDYLHTVFDSVMNYVFRDACRDLLCYKKITINDFFNTMGFLRGTLRNDTCNVLWNLLDSHDTPRFLFYANENKDILKIAVALQMTLSGMPFIYYGDEVGMTGDNDPDCRRGMLWDDRRDLDMLEYYKRMIQLRHENKALQTGNFVPVSSDNNIMVFEKQGEETLVIYINIDEFEKDINLKGVNMIDSLSIDGKIKPYQTIIVKK